MIKNEFSGFLSAGKYCRIIIPSAAAGKDV